VFKLRESFTPFSLFLNHKHQIFRPNLKCKHEPPASLNVHHCLLILCAPKLPPLIWIVSAARLQKSHLREPLRGKLEDSGDIVKLEVADLLCRPYLLVLVPDPHCDAVIFPGLHENVLWKSKLDADGVWLDLGGHIGVGDIAESVID